MVPLYVLLGIEFVLFYCARKKNVNKRKYYYLAALVILVLFQGFRSYSVGIDLDKKGGYLQFFEYVTVKDVLGPPGYKFEKIFVIYTYFIKLVFDNFTIFLLITSFIIHSSIILLIMKYSKKSEVSILMYLTLGLFTFTFSGLRQSLALAITVIAYREIQKKNLAKFIVVVVFASLFHKSAILFLPAYYLYNNSISNKTRYTFMSFSLLVVFLFNRNILELFNKLSSKSVFILENNGSIRMSLILLIILVVSVFFTNYGISNGSSIRQFRLEKNNKYSRELSGLSNLIFMALILQIFASQVTSFSRIGYYYYIYVVLLIPYVIKKINNIVIRRIFYSILIILCLVYFQYQTGSGYLEVVPYRFILQ